MLSKTTLNSLNFAIKLGQLAHSHPYKWVVPCRVEVLRSRSHLVGFFVSFVIMSLYEMFLVFRAIQALATLDREKNMGTIVNLCYNVCVYAIPVSMQVSMMLRWNQIPGLITGYINVYNIFKEIYVLVPDRKIRNGCEPILRTFRIVAVVIVLQNVALIMRAPHKSFFLTSLLTDNKHLVWYYKLPLVLIHWHIWLNIAAHLLLKASMLYSYAYPAVFIANEMILRRREEGSERTHPSLRTPQILVKQYRTMQVLQSMFDHCFKVLLLPGHKVLITSVAVLGLYGAIRIHGPRSILMAALGTAVSTHLACYFRICGKLYSSSRELLDSWGHRSSNRGPMKKFIRSCRPLSVHIGNFYEVRKTTVLVLFGVIANSTITILVV